MRAIFQRASGVSYLLACSLGHLMRDLFTASYRGASPVRRVPRPCARSTPMLWLEGLSERFEADDCAVERAAVEPIVAYGEGQPSWGAVRRAMNGAQT
jgi:hypothetical protein